MVTVAILAVATEGAVDGGSGQLLAERCAALGHEVLKRLALPPDRESIEAQLRAWVAEESIDVVVVMGAVGVTPSDVAPEAVRAVLERELPGFGEAVRRAHEREVGHRAVHGRELGGVAGGSFVFALSAEHESLVRAWDSVLGELLDPSSEASLIPLLPALAIA